MTDSSHSDDTGRRVERGPRPLRRQLVRLLVGTALVSLLTVGTLNLVAAWSLLNDGARNRMVSVAESRANSIEVGVERLLNRVSATAADLAVVESLQSFDAAFADLNDEMLDDRQSGELDAVYSELVIDPLASIDIDVGLDDVEPASNAGQYLQYHYSVPTLTDDADGIGADDASVYGSAHDELDQFLSSLAAGPGLDDVLLIAPSGDIVYSANKSIDLGTNLASGPYSDSLLARAVLDRLPQVRTGEAVIADFEIYIANGGRPTLFVAASAKAETEVVGTIAFSVPIEALNAITGADGEWENLGLGGGEAYVVGPDGLLFSESRAWIEDPDGYLESVDDPELARVTDVLGSPVGLQSVDSEAVRAARDGDTFVGTTKNYLGESTFAYATQISVGGSKWVVVAEQPIGEVRSPLIDYLVRLAIVMAVVLPVAALIGVLFANRLTRSIPPVVEMASEIADGARDVDSPDLGANEFGDLARRLEQRAFDLGRQEAALEAEYEQRRALLLSVLPPRLVQGEGEVAGTGEAIDTATVISIDIVIDGTETDEEEASELLRNVGEAAERAAAQLGIERVRSAADRLLFLAGVEHDDDGADTALDLAGELSDAVASMGVPDHESVVLHIGMSTGPVATGVLERGSLTYTVWGEPVRRALAIGALSTSNETLIDESTTIALRDRARVEPADDVIALDGEPMTLSRLTPASESVH